MMQKDCIVICELHILNLGGFQMLPYKLEVILCAKVCKVQGLASLGQQFEYNVSNFLCMHVFCGQRGN